MEKSLPYWIKSENFKVVGFYPYTSIIQNELFVQNHNYQTQYHEAIEEFGRAIKLKALEIESIRWDNKVVVEIEEVTTKSRLFVGYKDGIIKIGLSVYQQDSCTKSCNQKF